MEEEAWGEFRFFLLIFLSKNNVHSFRAITFFENCHDVVSRATHFVFHMFLHSCFCFCSIVAIYQPHDLDLVHVRQWIRIKKSNRNVTLRHKSKSSPNSSSDTNINWSMF